MGERNLKNRILKLEKSMLIDPEPLRIARFIFIPDVEPDGYICGSAEIVREPEESSESLRKRGTTTIRSFSGHKVVSLCYSWL